MRVIREDKNLPIKMWLDDIEEGALEQAKNLARLPFAYKHIALMPDCHQGYGMPIGGVLATEGVIIPNAVGVDIGCGMCAVKTSLRSITTDELKIIVGKIREFIPVGFAHQKEKQDAGLLPYMADGTCHLEIENALYQIGTLGGGNHFIEIQKGSDGHIWIMIHSGSRNLGYKVAKYYNTIAKELNKKWHSCVPPEFDLAFLPLDTTEGLKYLDEMNCCVEFAYANRKLMMSTVLSIFGGLFSSIMCSSEVNIAHNYARIESHFGKNVMVHRKGATLARKDTIGIIPGSQGTKSYIVKGLGNPESFHSCSHGAGRRLGRKQAQRELDLNEQVAMLNSKGILHSIRSAKDLDEAPSAYKDIDAVMKNQEDLVEILVELTPLAVVKG